MRRKVWQPGSYRTDEKAVSERGQKGVHMPVSDHLLMRCLACYRRGLVPEYFRVPAKFDVGEVQVLEVLSELRSEQRMDALEEELGLE